MTALKPHLKAFPAGFIATLVFHQGVFAILHYAGILPYAPFNMKATPPLGVPAVISLAFFGGLWGIPIWLMVKNATGAMYWIKVIAFGAIGPTAVAMGVVMPLKGVPFNPTFLVFGLILNAAWGLGLGLLMRLIDKK